MDIKWFETNYDDFDSTISAVVDFLDKIWYNYMYVWCIMLVTILFEDGAKNPSIVKWHFIFVLWLPKLGCTYDLSY